MTKSGDQTAEIDHFKKQIEQLERKVAQLRQLIDLVPDFYYAHDWEGRFILANKAVADAYGTTVDQVEGRLMHDLDPNKAQADRILAQGQEVMRKGEISFIPEEDLDIQGQTVTVQATDIPYIDVDTQKPAICGVLTDITERKRNEKIQREKSRLDHELDIARQIQLGLLPQEKPALPGFEIDGWSEAADKTGGDFFDWLTLPDGRTVVSIADVAGHGIGPAMIVAVCRAYFRASAGIEEPLEAAVSRVNELLTHDIPTNEFVTAAVGIVDPSTHSMRLFSAGHGPIFFYERASNEVHSWAADTIPLGILKKAPPASAREIRFSKGDILVLVTDGVFEWKNQGGEQFGTDRLQAAIRAGRDLSPGALIAHLREEVFEFSQGTEQADDFTAVILKHP